MRPSEKIPATPLQRPESNEKERETGNEGGEKKKTEHSYVFISSTLEIVFEQQKTFAK